MYGIKNNFNCIIFDLDNTLYDEKFFYLKFAHYLSKKYKFSYSIVKKKFNSEYKKNSKDPIKLILQLANIFSSNQHEICFNLLKNFKTKITISNSTKSLLEKLKKNKIKTGILTNGDVKIQKNKIDSLKIKKYFDKIVYARNCFKEKPHKSSFETILKLMKCKKKTTIFVGDNYHTDILGAYNINLKTVFIIKKTSKKKGINYCLSSLNKLNKLINFQNEKKSFSINWY
jgi:putative hydrolase of the HAD superfamily